MGESKAKWSGRWTATGVVGLFALAMGTWGFCEANLRLRQGWDGLDCFYHALRLFVLDWEGVPSPLPVGLQAARFLAPSVSLIAIVGAALSLFSVRLRDWRLQRLAGHTVICGAGSKGVQLALQCRRGGRGVVLVDTNESALEDSGLVESARVYLLEGDARQPEVLTRAGLARASVLYGVTGDDSANLEVAAQSRACRPAAGGSDEPLHCHVHLVDWRLCQMLRRSGRMAVGRAGHVEFFSVFEHTARRLLEAAPLDRGLIVTADDPRLVHVVLVDLGEMGESLAVQTALVGHFANGRRVQVTVVDPQVESRLPAFLARYPSFGQVCDLHIVASDALRPDLVERIGERVPGWTDPSRVLSRVYIAGEADNRNLETAMAVASLLRHADVPVHVRLKRIAGAAGLIHEAGAATQGEERDGLQLLEPFGMMDASCLVEDVEGGRLDELARRIHERYLTMYGPPAGTAPTRPVERPWADLDPTWRMANRAQADHINTKLRAVRCCRRRLDDANRGQALASFPADQTLMLARMEHQRWMAERWLNGWQPGPRNDGMKIHPCLVPWEELSARDQEKDADTVRNLAALLEACVGEGIFPVVTY